VIRDKLQEEWEERMIAWGIGAKSAHVWCLERDARVNRMYWWHKKLLGVDTTFVYLTYVLERPPKNYTEDLAAVDELLQWFPSLPDHCLIQLTQRLNLHLK
jgi:hypothetical protein